LKKSSVAIKSSILNYYYNEVYARYLFEASIQSRGIQYFEKSVEKYWVNIKQQVDNVLELGSGSGEHLKFVKTPPTESYVCLDLRKMSEINWKTNLPNELIDVVEFVEGDAQAVPYEDSFFDRTIGTCLLHHVDDPLQVLLEARRVTKPGGEIAFVMPTDPGMLNRMIKRIISIPRMRRLSEVDPQLIYALEHRNHISGLLELCKFVFQEDEIKIHYDPIKFHTWNFNLLCVVHVVRSNASPNYEYRVQA